MPADRLKVEVDGRSLELSNLDKVLFPQAGFTKGEVIDYYTRIAPVLLPHLTDRALTRIRFPNGVAGGSFFEKNAPAATPGWVRTENLPAPGSSKGRETIDYVVCDALPTLVWLANLAALELHTPQWKIGTHPDMMVVDLDPGAPAALRQCCQVALLMRDRLAADGVEAYPKTSGKKGMQLCCPIAGTQDADFVSGYARRIARELEQAHPKLVVSKMAKNLRPGKIFIDWSQNNAAKTTVAPYSLRAQPVPAVSTPLTWDEVEAGAAGKRPSTRPYTAAEVLRRVEKQGDLLAPLLDGGPELPAR
ncbi:non-homologous end-joining DNA ligase [Micromonospora sp. NPDC050980]|uniref:non-homologous end-joining DNA ligase n=1 Tax=Micromonospora sp. NPDC050980 TaxID=3155161 RepID=UPI00340AFE19